MATESNVIFYQTTNPKRLTKTFTGNSIWIACFVLVCMQPIPAVSPFHLSLRGEGSVNILVKGQGPIEISIDVNSADSSIDQSDKGASIKQVDDTPAQIEAKTSCTDSQIKQIETPAQPTEKVDPRELVLQAISNDDENETKSLIERFYDNMNGDEDLRPISAAAERCSSKVAEMLIKNGADLNIVGGGGWRPIHVATYANCKEIVNMLVDNGADFYAKVDLGYSAVDIALNDGRYEIFKLFVASFTERARNREYSRESTSEADSSGNRTEEVSSDSATEEVSSDSATEEDSSEDESEEWEEYPLIDEPEELEEPLSIDQSRWYSDESEEEWYKSMLYEEYPEMVGRLLENQANKESRGEESDVKLNLLE
ncbi:protein phosphatase 1 regulatory subunit 12A-like isoform X2 [Bradysia coprophila]|uniref:protein phosphatase 1 regulatory subunit 12A-like isoform X2 n=1 Tax=Bradysia coprophila TaxID=38358 RepID=UPI00187DAD8A|nr:protein phosphatase 1 regulatory subunit 12A-like isoform X2 [Bradysia coprophila]